MNLNQILRCVSVLSVAACLLLAGGAVASASITIAAVPVGNPGNAADPATGSIHGSVSYNYSIGEYDVTSSQYTAFLNAVATTGDPMACYDSAMAGTTAGNPGIIRSGSSGSYSYGVAGGRDNYPVTDVSWWDACRFSNWLANGQPTGPEGAGTTETGTYTLTATGIANNTVTRNANSTWAVPTEDEWYKAAYYSPTLNGGTGGYWRYPTQSKTISTSQANYYDTASDSVGDTTPVGSYPYPSYYGTFDQGGDVYQWNEDADPAWDQGLRGGSFGSGDGGADYLQSGYQLWYNPTDEYSDIGFRVVELPEPASVGVMGLGVIGLLARRRVSWA